jgi:exopolyphosphatase/guanosine-5'-triphosphate,3'-diphosphate pyrophosphatase
MKIATKWIDGIAADAPATAAAESVLRARLKAAMEMVESVSRKTVKDPEFVHQLRVATRRATAALDCFRAWLEPVAFKKLRKRLRRVRRVAGEARDLDIFVSNLAQRPETSHSGTKAIRRLLGRAEKDRKLARRRIIQPLTSWKKLRQKARAVWKSVQTPDLPPEFRQIDDNKNGAIDKPALAGEITFRDAARESLPVLLSAVHSALDRNLKDLSALHQLRLTTKRLRYAMEIFAGCFGPSFKRDFYPKVEALQQMLGEVNDCHQIVLRLDSLRKRIEHRAKPRADKRQALEDLLDELRKEQADKRDLHHKTFLGWCNEFKGSDFFASFEREIDSLPPREFELRMPGDRDQPILSHDARTGDSTIDINRSSILSQDAKGPESTARRIAAIDVGTNSIRLTVAEVSGDGRYRILDDEKETTRLGRGLETTGEMTHEAMERSAQAIARMKKIADGYNVNVLRAIGTCAIREAANRDELLALVERQAGLVVEPIVAEAEAYLAHTSVAHAFDLRPLAVAVVDIGGGSTEVVLSSHGVVEQIYTLPLGAVRLTEQFGGPENSAGPLYRNMRSQTLRILRRDVKKLPFVPQLIIGTGGTFTSLANVFLQREHSGKPIGLLPAGARGYERNRSDVRHLLEWLRKMPLSERVRVPGLSRDRADIIVAGLTIIERVMRHLGVNRVQVHDGGIRDGLLRTMAATLFPREDHGRDGPPDRMRSVRHFAAACSYEERHCAHVADLAVQIFDQLAEAPGTAPEKWTGPNNRALLEAAAILHDVGYFVNYSKHHQHSYHLIAHSDLTGFTRRETELIANIARYHCRAEPKRKHPNYAKLAKADRKLVRRLASILRIAEGLDRGHTENVRSIVFRVEEDTACFLLESADDPAVDIWGAEHKSGLFQKVFKFKPRFEWVRPAREVAALERAKADAL